MTFPHPHGNERPSFWIETSGTTGHHPVDEDLTADVVVVGAGIVGVTAAYLLAKAGKSVVVVDRERIAMAETGHTTAHLQTVVDTRLKDLIRMVGVEGAKLAWDSQLEAVRLIESIAHEERIHCDLERLDAYLYSPNPDDREMLETEMSLARDIGYEAYEASPDEVPFTCAHAIRYPDQGKFHVRKYLLGLAKKAEARGVRFYEGTEVTGVDWDGVAEVRTRDGFTLNGEWLVSATNVPLDTRVRFYHKITPYRTYAIGARVPRGVFGHALYWDTLDPYHYTRVESHEGEPLVILGGADHEVGHETNTDERFGLLEGYLGTATGEFETLFRWSGEWIETPDTLAYIGVTPGGPEKHLMVSGDSGTGMTNGTLGALMVTERILGRGTPWDELYDPSRATTSPREVGEWVRENVDNAARLVGGALQRSDVESLQALRPGEGAIIRNGLKRYAVSRGHDGRLRALSATCTHMGCTVKWNRAEESWDCPCHGGRYSAEGDILHGPPLDPLTPVDIEDVEQRSRRR